MITTPILSPPFPPTHACPTSCLFCFLPLCFCLHLPSLCLSSQLIRSKQGCPYVHGDVVIHWSRENLSVATPSGKGRFSLLLQLLNTSSSSVRQGSSSHLPILKTSCAYRWGAMLIIYLKKNAIKQKMTFQWTMLVFMVFCRSSAMESY